MTLARQWNPATQQFDGQVYKPGALDDGGNGDRSAVSPIVEPVGSTSGGADNGLTAVPAEHTVGPSAPPEDAAAGALPSSPPPAAAQPSLFDMPKKAAWA